MTYEDGNGHETYQGSGCGCLLLLVILGLTAVVFVAAYRGLF